MSSAYNVVWFKRDLRLHDHTPLVKAAERGPVLCLYIVEPSLWAAPDAANQHYRFILESLRELYRALRQIGGQLHVVTGEVVDILDRLNALAPFQGLYAHEETGNALSFQRDIAVGRWCRAHGVGWHEYPQFGVVRRLSHRNLWQAAWEQHVAQPCRSQPVSLGFAALPWSSTPPPTPEALGLDPFQPANRQVGGRSQGLKIFQDFLVDRSKQYRGGLSSPLSAPSACSRISPYLAYGCLSLREIVQATRRQILALPGGETRHKASLTAFISRLYWHCHFIQKLESEPALEYCNMHRGYDGLREYDWNPAHFAALTAGRTGWPLVDACIAMLRETGWINFRMRAMLVSVAAYPLWLHWQPVGQWLARQFLDYEPGIHWSQMQMQSGTTGINIPRIYNPIKQAQDHDPRGLFVRRWLPALRRVPDCWLFEPWRMPADLQARCGLRVGESIAEPLVDLASATRTAKSRLFERRTNPEVRAAKKAIIEKHGSRKRSPSRSGKKTTSNSSATQLALEL